MNEARSFCSACLDDEQERIYVFGGADANGNGLRSAEVLIQVVVDGVLCHQCFLIVLVHVYIILEFL
jgi:hypothetical protein